MSLLVSETQFSFNPHRLGRGWPFKALIYFQMEAGKPGVVGPGGAATSEGVLANFFNSLLSKKTGQAAGMPGAPGAQINAPGAENCKLDGQL